MSTLSACAVARKVRKREEKEEEEEAKEELALWNSLPALVKVRISDVVEDQGVDITFGHLETVVRLRMLADSRITVSEADIANRVKGL